MRLKTIQQIKNLSKKRVIVRVDFNVPMKDGQVVDDFKIVQSLPTIKYLLNKGAQVLLISHLGRPKGVKSEFSLLPVAKKLGKLLGEKIGFSYFVPERIAKEFIDKKVVLLENVRFLEGEEKNSALLAQRLAKLGNILVFDGFGVSHRHSASVTGVAKYLPTYAGLLLEKEIDGLSKIIDKPKKPLVAIIGGAKTETKIPILRKMLNKADHILIGGGIFNTYLWAKGYKIGDSLVDKKFKKEILKICQSHKVILPVDVVVGDKMGKNTQIISLQQGKYHLPAGASIFDIGPETVARFSTYIKRANTLIMNGALGYFEQPAYKHGTFAITRLFASRSKGKAFGVAGGGETVEILQKLDLCADVDLVSTGGGAMLEFLSGDTLPGIKIVNK